MFCSHHLVLGEQRSEGCVNRLSRICQGLILNYVIVKNIFRQASIGVKANAASDGYHVD